MWAVITYAYSLYLLLAYKSSICIDHCNMITLSAFIGALWGEWISPTKSQWWRAWYFLFFPLNKLLNKWYNCKSYVLHRGFCPWWDEHLTDDNSWDSQWQQLSFISLFLTNWGRDKRAAILQTTYSRMFSAMKTMTFFIQIALNMSPRVDPKCHNLFK